MALVIGLFLSGCSVNQDPEAALKQLEPLALQYADMAVDDLASSGIEIRDRWQWSTLSEDILLQASWDSDWYPKAHADSAKCDWAEDTVQFGNLELKCTVVFTGKGSCVVTLGDSSSPPEETANYETPKTIGALLNRYPWISFCKKNAANLEEALPEGSPPPPEEVSADPADIAKALLKHGCSSTVGVSITNVLKLGEGSYWVVSNVQVKAEESDSMQDASFNLRLDPTNDDYWIYKGIGAGWSSVFGCVDDEVHGTGEIVNKNL